MSFQRFVLALFSIVLVGQVVLWNTPHVTSSSDRLENTYTHQHHSGDQEHSHKKDEPHPPLVSFVVDLWSLGNVAVDVFQPTSVTATKAYQASLPLKGYSSSVFRPPIA